MNSRLKSVLLPIILAIPLGAVAASPPAHPAPAAAPPAADEAQAFRVAESKLSALAKEGSELTTPPPSPAPKKQLHKKAPSRKRVAASRKAQPAAAKGLNGSNRHLTQGELQNILATTRDFTGADLSGMSLVGIDLNGAKLNRANLQRANLQRADLAECDLELADLTGADLRGASLNQARLRGTRLEGARIEGALWIDKTVCKRGSVGNCLE
ncbi:pentapeptide repeat-containing protein [Geomonas sp.]|uniref:pentapeptide repeat-containing protein n=1 Tax=Geomonas sp. TaxID=2651584 RepID=UPI002B46974E|nr:pentapeptide repeat-containing protein [Geomonas sp.]HJV33954.1 pentapeptide repeat-containing protein [Geomonas sp.]